MGSSALCECLASALWGQTDLEFSPLRPGQGRVLPVPGVSLGSDCLFGVMSLWGQGSRVLFGVECSLGSSALWGQTDLEFSPLRPGQGCVLPVPGVSLGSDCLFGVMSLWGQGSCLFGVRPICLFVSLWGQTDFVSLGSDRFCLFVSLWGQTDLEFSPLRLGQRRVLPVPGVSLGSVSLGSDRFRIFSAQAMCLFGVRLLFGVRPISDFSLGSLWGLLFGVIFSLGSDRFRIFSAQARPKARSSSARCLFGVRPICLFGVRPVSLGSVSLGSDRFRIFSAQAKGAFQCQEISPRVRFALEQSGESRRQVPSGAHISGPVQE